MGELAELWGTTGQEAGIQAEEVARFSSPWEPLSRISILTSVEGNFLKI
jgi:hypothetical protein